MPSRAGTNLGVTKIAVLVMALSASLWVLIGTPAWYDQLCLCLGFVLVGTSAIIAIWSLPLSALPTESRGERWARIRLVTGLILVTIRGPLVLIFK